MASATCCDMQVAHDCMTVIGLTLKRFHVDIVSMLNWRALLARVLPLHALVLPLVLPLHAASSPSVVKVDMMVSQRYRRHLRGSGAAN